MIVIALLLIAAGVALTVAMVMQNTDPTTLDIFGVTIQGTQVGLFVAGAAAMLAFLLGLYLLKASLARSHRRRSQMRALKNDRDEEARRVEADRARLEEEKARLAEEKARLAAGQARPVRGATAQDTAPVDLTAREQRMRTDH